MIKLKDYQKAGTSLTLLPILPTIILYRHGLEQTGKLLLLIFLFTALICFANQNIGDQIFKFGQKIGKKIGHILSLIALSIVYYIAVVPTAILMKLFKRDRLKLNKTDTNSYWKDLKLEKNYEDQF